MRHTPRREIGGCIEHAPLALANFAAGHSGIGEPADHQRDVYARCNKVDVAVVENNIDVERGMVGEKDRKARHEEKARESHGSAEA